MSGGYLNTIKDATEVTPLRQGNNDCAALTFEYSYDTA